jgi:hypothetical protein
VTPVARRSASPNKLRAVDENSQTALTDESFEQDQSNDRNLNGKDYKSVGSCRHGDHRSILRGRVSYTVPTDSYNTHLTDRGTNALNLYKH